MRIGRVPVSLGDATCQQEVLEYECDKEFIVDDEGAWFTCDPVREEVTESLGNLAPCGPLVDQVTYERVTRCQKRRLADAEIPQDYDTDPFSCYYVNGSTSQAPGGSPTDDSISSATPIAPPTAMILTLVYMMALNL
jgi:hypothetical protein